MSITSAAYNNIVQRFSDSVTKSMESDPLILRTFDEKTIKARVADIVAHESSQGRTLNVPRLFGLVTARIAELKDEHDPVTSGLPPLVQPHDAVEGLEPSDGENDDEEEGEPEEEEEPEKVVPPVKATVPSTPPTPAREKPKKGDPKKDDSKKENPKGGKKTETPKAKATTAPKKGGPKPSEPAKPDDDTASVSSIGSTGSKGSGKGKSGSSSTKKTGAAVAFGSLQVKNTPPVDHTLTEEDTVSMTSAIIEQKIQDAVAASRQLHRYFTVSVRSSISTLVSNPDSWPEYIALSRQPYAADKYAEHKLLLLSATYVMLCKGASKRKPSVDGAIAFCYANYANYY